MKPNSFIKELESKNLLTGEGFALDLGCGEGKDSAYLVQKGYDVTVVDKNKDNIDFILARNEYIPVMVVCSNIEDFDIEKNKYSLIICNNVLPFISDKSNVEKIILNMSNGLTLGGIMYFSLFGVKDAWFGKLNMSFFDQGEVEQMLGRISGITLLYKTTKEGYDKTIKGDIKYWHIFRFVYKKP